MKAKILKLIFRKSIWGAGLLLICSLNQALAQSSTFKVVYVEGKVIRETTGKPLKVGDEIDRNEKLSYKTKDATVAIYNDRYGRIVLPEAEQKTTTMELSHTSGALALSREAGEMLLKFANGQVVSQEDFEYVYQKNNGGYEQAKAHGAAKYREYLDLYVIFKRKVMEAEAVGLDTTTAFKNELATYLKQLAQPYLIEQDVLDALIKEAWDYSHKAAAVSHILFQVDEDAAPQDTLVAYRAVMAVRDTITRGLHDFAYMAEHYSADPSVKDNKGYLSYFTAFDFVYPFEKAAFTTPIGQVSQPVRTKFGYHLIKVHDVLPTKGVREVSHILVRAGANYAAKDSVQALNRIQEAYKKAKAGGDFAELAKEYSDDPNSKARGGVLGSRYIPITQMQDIVFKLQDGEVSKPIRSEYGWHIMKVKVTDADRTFDDMKKVLRNRVTRDKRATIAEDRLIEKLKTQYGYQAQAGNIQKLEAGLPKNYGDHFGPDSLTAVLRDLKLFSFAKSAYTADDFARHVAQERRGGSPRPAAVIFREELEGFTRARMLAYEEQQLEEKYLDFRNLKKEYRDGILLFTLTEQKVWRKAVEDTMGLRAYYETVKEKLTAGERVQLRQFRAADEQSLKNLDSLLTAMAKQPLDTVLKNHLMFNVRASRQIIAKAEAARFYKMKVGAHTAPEAEGKNFVFSYVEAFLPAGVKSYDEARTELTSAYQTYLEEYWVKDLAEKYPYKLNEKSFDNLFKSY